MLQYFKTVLNLVKTLPTRSPITGSAGYHILAKPNILSSSLEEKFLKPVCSGIIPSCGFKVRGWLRRRCKACYFVMRERRLFVICDKHPRHKQMSMVKKPKNTWMLSHATQGKVRPW